MMVPVLLIVSMLSFALIYLSPGDPVRALLSQGGGVVDEDVAAQMRSELGLDEPVPVQYAHWLGGVLTGDLGTSISTGRPVAAEIGRRMPATLFLAGVSMVIVLLISVPLGTLAAARRGGVADYAVRGLSFVGAAAPGFLVALLLVYVFAVRLRMLPSLGSMRGAGWVLPVATLVVCEAATYVRQVRTLVLAELGQDYVASERARGICLPATVARSVLPAVLPALLVLTGMTLGQLLGGTAIIETVFNWPGVGSYAVQAVTARDYPVIQGYVLLMALLFMLVNLAVDLAQARLDPRVRSELGRVRP